MKNKFEVRGNLVAIFLRRKDGSVLETIIDLSDLTRVDEYVGSWCASWSPYTKSFYATGHTPRVNGKQRTIHLHRWIMKTPIGLQVDHINNDTLRNIRENLRNVTNNINTQNKKGSRVDSASGFRGVSWKKATNKWQSRVMVNGKSIYLGYYTNLQEATTAAHNARVKFMAGYIY